MLSLIIAHGPVQWREHPVDEVETVRTISGESPGAITLLKRERENPGGNVWWKALSVM